MFSKFFSNLRRDDRLPHVFILQIDSHGNRFQAVEETSINTPAIASAIVTKDFKAETCDQISLQVPFISLLLIKIK